MVMETSSLNMKTELSQDVDKLLRVGPSDLDDVMKHHDVTIEMLEEMVNNIREWYKKQAHLPQGQLHDRLIVGYLMILSFSLEHTKRNIDNFYTARVRIPELMCDRDPKDEAWMWYLQRFWYVLPKKTPENYRVIMFRMDKEENAVVIQGLKQAVMLCEYRVWNDAALGDCWIFDYKHSTLQQAVQFTPMLISKIIYVWKLCFSTRLISVHLLNLPPFASTILKLFKMGLSSKLVDRIHVANSEDLLTVFPKDVLPKEYGGSEYSCQNIADEWVKVFLSEPWCKYFTEQDSVRSDESKRAVPKKADDLLGTDGSFKKLCLD